MECKINLFLLVCVKMPTDKIISVIKLINSYLLINDVCVRRACANMRTSVSVCVYTSMLLNVYCCLIPELRLNT